MCESSYTNLLKRLKINYKHLLRFNGFIENWPLVFDCIEDKHTKKYYFVDYLCILVIAVVELD